MPLQITGTIVSNVWTNALADGSLAAPSHTFSNNATVGMYRAGTSLAFAAAGANTMVVSGNSTLTVGNVALGPAGSSGAKVIGPWVARNSAADNNWHAVAWSPELSLFAAVAYTGTGNRVQTSSDGIVWTTRTSASDSVWTAILWVSSLRIFVAVGFSAAMTSPDGVTWTARTASASQFYGLAWSPSLSLLVAVGQTPGLGIMSSPDGVTWTTRTSPGDKAWQGVAWAPSLGLFAAVGAGGTGSRAMTSTNGTSWTLQSTPIDNNWVGIAWSPELSLFAATSTTGSGNRAMTSPDGVTWTLRSTPSDQEWRTLLWVSDMQAFVAVAFGGGYSGTGNKVMYSYNGIVWSTQTTTSSVSIDQQWLGATYSPELKRLVVVGQSGTGNRVMSADVSDQIGSALAPSVRFAARANTGIYSAAANTFSIAAGGVGVVDVFADGVRINAKPIGGLGTWATQSTWDAQYGGIVWSSTLKLFVAIAYTAGSAPGYHIAYSSDGVTWAYVTAPELNQWVGIAWSPSLNLFVAVAQTGTNRVMTSSNGTSWTVRSASAAKSWRRVAWSPALGMFAATAQDVSTSSIMTSTNGTSWVSQTTPNVGLEKIAWSPELGLFCAVGSSGAIITSSNGTTWIQRTSPTTNAHVGVAWSPELGMFAVTANTGTGNRIVTSTDGVTWVVRPSPADNSWNSVVWSSSLGVFVAVAYLGTVRSMYSSDGITWRLFTTTVPALQWADIAWSPELNRFASICDNSLGDGKRAMILDGILQSVGGNLSVTGVITSANPWIRGRFTSTAAAAYLPMTLLQGSGIAVTNSTFLYAPVAGRYAVGFNSIFNNSSARCDLYIRLNGGDLIHTLSEDTTTGHHYRGASTIIYLYPTDYIQFYVNSGTTYPPTAATGEWSNFYMALIS